MTSGATLPVGFRPNCTSDSDRSVTGATTATDIRTPIIDLFFGCPLLQQFLLFVQILKAAGPRRSQRRRRLSAFLQSVVEKIIPAAHAYSSSAPVEWIIRNVSIAVPDPTLGPLKV